MERLDQLMSFLNENPNDSFLQYAIALEHIKKGEPEKGLIYFENLLKHDPDYVGTYYHLAKLYLKLGMKPEAIACYENGMGVATKLSDFHALAELKNAYTNLQLGIEEDDE